jgi:hypothetical protein
MFLWYFILPTIYLAENRWSQYQGCRNESSRIGVIFPDSFLSVLGSDPYPTLMSTIKLTRRENLIQYTFWLGPGGPTDKENQVKMYIKYCFRYITSLIQ